MWVRGHSRYHLNWVRFFNFSYPNPNPNHKPKPNPNPNARVRGQGHGKWRRSIDHVRLTIGAPFYLVPFSSYLMFDNIVTLKSGLEVKQGH